MPVQPIVARDLARGDVVRIEDPQAYRVERALRDGDRVELQLRHVGLAVSELVRLSLPVDALVDRLGSVTS